MKAKLFDMIMYFRNGHLGMDEMAKYVPEDPEVFSLGLEFNAGVEGEKGSDLFNLVVVTPKWLLYNSEEKIIIGRHKLIVFNYNAERLKNFIISYVESCTGDTWQEVAEKIGRLGKWEYEDYQKIEN